VHQEHDVRVFDPKVLVRNQYQSLMKRTKARRFLLISLLVMLGKASNLEGALPS
jgi:membrane protein CcdC involved in cytochrome C biogenesis